MASIDENVEVGLELTTSALRLTGRVLVAIMDLFLEEDDRKNYYQDLNNKQGKQKLKDLFTKYENTGVQSLGDNLSSEERKFFEKELKAMGVDFSIRKIGTDEYSLFFAGKDAEAIEKGMENAITKYAKREQKIEKMKDMFTRTNTVTEEEIDEESKTKDKSKGKTKDKNNKQKTKFSVDQLQKKQKEMQKEKKKEQKVKTKKQNRSL